MPNFVKDIKITHFYPILISIFPILSLAGSNPNYVQSFALLIRSLIISGLISLLLIFLASLFAKNFEKGAMIASIIILTFISYGHLYLFLLSLGIFQPRHSFVAIILILLNIFLISLIITKKTFDGQINRFSFLVSGLLVIMAIIPLLKNGMLFPNKKESPDNSRSSMGISTNEEIKPDIYLIILDSYTRSDILSDAFSFDNSEFIAELDQMGFYIGVCSQSNYPTTRYSVSSVFNMDYLDKGNLFPLSKTPLIKILREAGYSIITFKNRSEGHFDLGEDRLLSRQSPLYLKPYEMEGINEFEAELIQTNGLKIFYDMPQLFPWVNLREVEFEEHFLQTKYILQELPNLANLAGPKFVFAHLLIPHEPYIFSPNGDYKFEPDKKQGYRNSVNYINSEIPKILDQIIKNSINPPVIILMGDHGADLEGGSAGQRLSILNAYFVNSKTKEFLSQESTPINSFRAVLNGYFDTQYQILPNKSYNAWGPGGFDESNIVANKCISVDE